MAEDTTIEWTHHTFNAWSGCQKAHTGCLNCYAEHSPPSWRRHAKWGTAAQGATRVPASDAYMRQPLKWVRAAAKAGERHRVFCGSMMDVLEVTGDATLDAIMDAQREKLWPIMRETVAPRLPESHSAYRFAYPGLDYLLLTKRAGNWRLVPSDVRPLVWLGTSVSDQKTADEAVPRLLAAEGFRYRFLSVEPMVGPVALSQWLERIDHCGACGAENQPQDNDKCPMCGVPGSLISTWGFEQATDYRTGKRYANDGPSDAQDGPQIHWVIVGGESGRKSRPCHVEWVRDVVRQCREAGVRCFVKQLGSVWAKETGATTLNEDGEKVPDTKGGDWKNWPEDLRVREFPGGAS